MTALPSQWILPTAPVLALAQRRLRSVDYGSVTGIANLVGGSGYVTQSGIKKFQDGLPVLCDPTAGWDNCTDNNLGQHIPIAVPDTTLSRAPITM